MADEYVVGEEVLVLRSNGSWSPGTITVIRDDKVKVLLKEGSKIIRRDMMGSLVKKADPLQAQFLQDALLASQQAALENVMIANRNVCLANEKVMLQNALLSMQQQQAWMSAQGGYAPACTVKPASKGNTPTKSQKGTGKKTATKEECTNPRPRSGTECTSAGLSTFASDMNTFGSAGLTTFASRNTRASEGSDEGSESREALPNTTVMM